MLVVTPIFLETFGTGIFSETELKIESRSLYFISNLVGQISFSFFTSLKSGFIVLPCFESMSQSRAIYTNNAATSNQIGFTVGCLLLACALTLLFSLVIYFTNTGILLSRIPRNIVDAMMFMVGITSLIAGVYPFIIKDRYFVSTLLVILSILITVGAVVILKRTNNPKYLVLYLLFIIAFFNFCRLFLSSDKLTEYRIFLFQDAKPLSFRMAIDLVRKAEFSLDAITRNLPSIISMAIYPLISISTSLPYFLNCLELKADFNNEILASGLSNGMCSIGLFPSSFNCSGSLLFALCGANSRWHSFFSGIALISMLFIFHMLSPLIPSFAISLLTQFIGVTLLLEYVSQIAAQNWPDRSTLFTIVVAFCAARLNVIILLIFGIGLNYLIVNVCNRHTKSITLQKVDKKAILKIRGGVDFRNLHKIPESVGEGVDEIVFDLEKCSFVDYSANLELYELACRLRKAQKKVQILGSPSNLNKNLISDN